MKKEDIKWAITITIFTFFLSMTFNLISDILVGNANLVGALFVLFAFILIGIVADIVGTAVAASTPAPFNAMAAKKVKGAKKAVFLVSNAAKVTNILNDVVGDICGIISGATVGVITIKVASIYSLGDTLVVGTILSGLSAALTVGGKAAGKGLAMTKTNEIIYAAARVVDVFTLGKKDE